MPIIINSGINIGGGITIGNGGGGLVLELNAQDYSGSGVTWPAAVGNDATLYNSPQYIATPPTFFTFDRTLSEWADLYFPTQLSNWTVEVWFKRQASLIGQSTSLVCNVSTGGLFENNLNFSIGTNRHAEANYDICTGFFNGTWYNTSGFSPAFNTWYCVTGTYDGNSLSQYVNGLLDSSVVAGVPSLLGSQEVRIARRPWLNVSSGALFDGNIGLIKIYNTALNSTQVLANFNTDRGRFGI